MAKYPRFLFDRGHAVPYGSDSLNVLVSAAPTQVERLNAYRELADFIGCEPSDLFTDALVIKDSEIQKLKERMEEYTRNRGPKAVRVSEHGLFGGLPQTGHTTGGTYCKY